MGFASIEVSGPDAQRLAGDLRAELVGVVPSGQDVSPVEVQRSADMVIAIIGLVFGGVPVADTIWQWWQGGKSQGVTVKILLEDGTVIDLSGVDQGQLQIELDRRSSAEDR